MKSKRRSVKQMLEVCDAVGPEDGVDPRLVPRGSSGRRTNRKTLQLCSEIARTLNWVLAWESGDEVLRTLAVTSVSPAPNCRRVLVTVFQAAEQERAEPGEVL